MYKIAKTASNTMRCVSSEVGFDVVTTWVNTPEWQRNNKMTFVKHIIEYPDCTIADIHGVWLGIKKSEGWVYGEVKDRAKKIHNNLVDYEYLDALSILRYGVFINTVKGLIEYYN